jgi:hypothetical protein
MTEPNEVDRAARQAVSRLAGHGRVRASGAYLGAVPSKSNAQAPRALDGDHRSDIIGARAEPPVRLAASVAGTPCYGAHGSRFSDCVTAAVIVLLTKSGTRGIESANPWPISPTAVRVRGDRFDDSSFSDAFGRSLPSASVETRRLHPDRAAPVGHRRSRQRAEQPSPTLMRIAVLHGWIALSAGLSGRKLARVPLAMDRWLARRRVRR